MGRRIVTFGAIAAVIATAVVLALTVVDVIAVRNLTGTLARTLLVVAILTTAILIIVTLGRAVTPRPPLER